MSIKEGDFIKLDFTGRLTESGEVFDTSKKSVAEKEGLLNDRMDYAPLRVCVGENHLLPGLDKALVGKESKQQFSVTLPPEDAFGKKTAKMIKLMPIKLFKKEGVKPVPGLDVNIDGTRGTVKSVAGNRVIVDFNHPLSSHEVTYDIDVMEIISDAKEQAVILISNLLRFEPKISVTEGTATIELPVELPSNIQDDITKKLLERTSIKKTVFSVLKKQNP